MAAAEKPYSSDTSASRAATGVFDRQALFWALALFFVGVYLHGQWLGFQGLADLSTLSADNGMRLQEVRDLAQGQGWFDTHQYRYLPPRRHAHALVAARRRAACGRAPCADACPRLRACRAHRVDGVADSSLRALLRARLRGAPAKLWHQGGAHRDRPRTELPRLPRSLRRRRDRPPQCPGRADAGVGAVLRGGIAATGRGNRRRNPLGAFARGWARKPAFRRGDRTCLRRRVRRRSTQGAQPPSLRCVARARLARGVCGADGPGALAHADLRHALRAVAAAHRRRRRRGACGDRDRRALTRMAGAARCSCRLGGIVLAGAFALSFPRCLAGPYGGGAELRARSMARDDRRSDRLSARSSRAIRSLPRSSSARRSPQRLPPGSARSAARAKARRLLLLSAALLTLTLLLSLVEIRAVYVGAALIPVAAGLRARPHPGASRPQRKRACRARSRSSSRRRCSSRSPGCPPPRLAERARSRPSPPCTTIRPRCTPA